jgi:hypothetical protein
VKGDAHWDDYVSALLPFNATWASNAAALVFILSDTLIAAPGSTEYKPAGTNSFDAGAAWGYLALQATRLGLATTPWPVSMPPAPGRLPGRRAL